MSRALSKRYDAAGRLTNRWSIAKGHTYYAYDWAGNLTNVDYAASTDLRLAYDGLNRLTNLVDGVGTTSYTYTDLGQLLTENGPWDDDTVTYAYTNRLRTSLSLAQPGASAWEQTYAYDAMRRLTTTTSPAGAFGYAYTGVSSGTWPATLVKKLTLPTGGYITNAFDSVGRWNNTRLVSSQGATISKTRCEYNGNQVNAIYRDENTPDEGWINYEYDNIGQLRKTADDGLDRLHEQFGYAYDAAHNLQHWTNNALVRTFNVNAVNEVTNVTRTGGIIVAGFTTSTATNIMVAEEPAVIFSDKTYLRTNVGVGDGWGTVTAIAQSATGQTASNSITVYLPYSVSFSYDLNGNLLSDGYRAFAYDDENQLIEVLVTNAWKSEFAYDGKLRRRVRKEYAWQKGAWVQTNEVRYVYDGNLVIQERDGNNAPVTTYTRGLDLSGTLQGAGGIGGLLAMTHPLPGLPPNYYYRADLNGNIVTMINTNELIVAKYLYEPFGKVIAMNGPMASVNRYRFSSKEAHEPSGLVYYGYRYYEPWLQRWPNRDPINEPGFKLLTRSGGTINWDEERNLYAFLRNNSVNNVDPLGQSVLAPVAGWIGTDCAVPDPTDAAWPKWAVYGIAICAAAAIDACFTTRTYTCRVFCPLLRQVETTTLKWEQCRPPEQENLC